jgi:NTE family protein
VFNIGYENKRSKVFYYEKDIEDKSILTLQFHNFKFISPESFSEGNSLSESFRTFLLNTDYYYINDFDKLKIPFRAVATDLVTGQSVSLSSGNLSRIIKASCSVPLYFSPVRIDSMILVDGGIMANLPVRFAKEFNPDIVLVMDATTPIYSPSELTNTLRISDQAISVSMNYFSQNDAELADVLIKLNLENDSEIDKKRNESYLNFKDIRKYIDAGYISTLSKISEIKQKIESLSSLDNSTNNIVQNDNTHQNIIISNFELFINDEIINETNKIITNEFPVKL